MKILVSNDDGINAPGLWILVHALKEVGEVTVVAPDREQSGVGPSLSLGVAINAHAIPFTMDGVYTYSVQGTPGDAVILGLAKFAPESELVVSGINQGHNTGNEMVISGTVGAALHARLRGVPAIAVSLTQLDSTQHEIAACLTALIVRKMQEGLIPKEMLLNVNIPHAEIDEIKGIVVTKPAHRLFADEVEEREDTRKRSQYFLVRKRVNIDTEEVTDFGSIRANSISLTPLDDRLNTLPASLIPEAVCHSLFEELKERIPAPPRKKRARKSRKAEAEAPSEAVVS